MAIVKCTECGNEISDKATFCPHCGCPMEALMKATQDGEKVGFAKKKGIIVVCIIAVLALVGILLWFFMIKLPNDQVMAEYTAVVEMYNAEVEKYNGIVGEYNTKIEEIISANSELDTAISEAQTVLTNENVPYDEETVNALNTAISNAHSKKCNVPSVLVEVNTIDGNTLFTENADVESSNEVVNSELAELSQSVADAESVNEHLEVPDYSKLIAEISDSVEQVEKSYAVQKQITYPTQEFVVEKLGNVENVSVIVCVTEDNDPNGYLGTEGGYTAQIFFSSPLLKTETISENELLEIGTDAGGSIEIYATVEDAEARNEYLASFDGSEYDTGKHIVLGTMVVRVSTNLTTTKQDSFSDELIEALIKL